MALIQWDEYLRDRPIYVMNRTAIDSFGCVGSLFDGYRDEVIDTVIVNHYKKSGELRDIRQCKIIYSSINKNENLLGMIEIDEATRLSLLLNLRKNDGIGKIIDYDIPVKENTRLLWYTHIKRTNQLPEDSKDIKYIHNPITSKIKGTHIISSVEWGIDIAVVLQLPNDIDTMKEIDGVLEKVCNFLLTDQSISCLEQNEKSILRKIINTNVYSNINEIKYMHTLVDVCMCIENNKYTIIDQPISYKIRPITWFYPQYIREGNTCIPLPQGLVNSLEQYILTIRTDTKKLMILVDEDLSRQLNGKLPKVLSVIHNMCLNVTDQCENEVKRFTKLVLRVRKGEIMISKIKRALKGKRSIMMKTTIRNLGRTVHDLEKKIIFINELNQQNFRYINITDYGIKTTDSEEIMQSKLVENDQYNRILCSNDVLNNNNYDKFSELRDALIKEHENNVNLQLLYADFSYSLYNLKNMMILPRIVFNIDNDKLNVTTPVESKTVLSKSTRISSTNFLSTTQKTNTSPSPSPQPPSVSFDEKLTSIESAIDPSITDLSTTDIQTYNPLATNIDIYSETSEETMFPALVPIKNHNYTSAETKAETPVPSSLVDMPVKLELSLPSIVEKTTIISPPKVTELLQLPSILNSKNKVINVLLIGETGVGKSTFINALANYLAFDTLNEAENDQPVVLIPGSFLVNNDDNNTIEERIVKFGNINDEQNKHLKHPRRSITERCRSYEFYLNDNNDQKLRIIDTPGFGDGRGLLQDDHRMQHIMKYIKQFSPLNAICFLLDANEIRVNIFLRSCLTQLFSFLGPNIRNRIIFCFTNSRPAFYAPGRTVPLLKKMLSSFTLARIPFTKANIFYYDNESFRYLVGLQNGITFGDLEKKDYEMSWSKSVAESKRFIHYICDKCTVQMT